LHHFHHSSTLIIDSNSEHGRDIFLAMGYSALGSRIWIEVKILLHIGTDKTGSTAIQNALSINRDWFLSRSIYIPETGFGHNNGHAQVLEALHLPELKLLSLELHEAYAQGYQTALLSWEGMIGFNTAKIRRLVKALSPFSINVLIYVREQAEIIQSGHLQVIGKGNHVRKIATVALPSTIPEKLTAFFFIRNRHRNYYRQLRKWERCTPDVEFSVRVFSRSTLHSGDVIADLLHTLDISKDNHFEESAAGINPSIDVEEALLIQSWGKSKKSEREVDALIYLTHLERDRGGVSTKYFLDESSVQAIRKHFKSSNQRLARRYIGSEEYPFTSLTSCWRNEDLANVQMRAEHLLKNVEQISQRTSIATGTDIPELVDFVEGWNKPADWGVWSNGKTSIARFCIPDHHINGMSEALRLVIVGRYYGKNKATLVTVNAIEFGEQVLSNDSVNLTIPLTALNANREIVVTFSHQQPISPLELNGTKDRRELAFAMTHIGYTVIESPKPSVSTS
jgi:hypothetical protein